MRYRLVWMLFAGLLSGCLFERLAGTEVGNPEVTVSARFGFIGADSLALISSMDMMVMKMEYRMPDSSRDSIWNYPAGMEVDLASPVTALNLPSVKVASAGWTSAELMLVASYGDSTLPDSIAYKDYSNPRFIKLIKKMNGDSIRFLFELPEGMHMKLQFDSSRLQRWQTGNKVSVEILFDCAKWTSAISAQAYQIRLDGAGKPYVLVSPSENVGLHTLLKSLFPQCFLADGAQFM